MKKFDIAEYSQKWENKSKEQKIRSITFLVFFALFTIGTILSFVFSSHIFGDSSIFDKNVSNNHTLNVLYKSIPAVIKTGQIITIGMIVYHAVKWIISLLISKTTKGITIIKLLSSFLKYLIAIIIFLCILSAWGVNTTTLIAGAGVLSLIVGLGAQSLVSDIIAGIFIVFEGTYKIGDIIVIDGWRGTVKEIGIRSTKVIDSGGNIKTINNSSITSVINQTQELSVAKCVVGIEYDEDLQRVEQILNDSMQRLQEKIPQIVSKPSYKGVSELGDSSVDLLIIAECKEEDIYGVQRAMNREIKLIFDENNINIPFSQLVVHDGDKQ